MHHSPGHKKMKVLLPFTNTYSITNYMGASDDSINSKIQKRFAKYAMKIFHNDNHPIYTSVL